MLTIKTKLLQDVITSAIKGNTFNRIVPITSLMHIKVEDGLLQATTTDRVNTLVVKQKVDTDTAFEVVLEAKQFHELVVRTTSQDVTLELNAEGNMLTYTGNGVYQLELPVELDESGKFVDLIDNTNLTPIEINIKELKSKLHIAKAALPITYEAPELNIYYLHDNIIATDAYKITSIENLKELKENRISFNKDFVELLEGLNGDKGKFYVDSNNNVILQGEIFTLYGQSSKYIDDFPIEGLKPFLDTDLKYTCVLNKNELVSVLDRLNLFVSVYDKNSIQLTFNEDNVVVNSKRKNGEEEVMYENDDLTMLDDFEPFTCLVDLSMLSDQLQAQNEEVVTVHFGDDTVLKITTPNVTQVVSLLEEDN